MYLLILTIWSLVIVGTTCGATTDLKTACDNMADDNDKDECQAYIISLVNQMKEKPDLCQEIPQAQCERVLEVTTDPPVPAWLQMARCLIGEKCKKPTTDKTDTPDAHTTMIGCVKKSTTKTEAPAADSGTRTTATAEPSVQKCIDNYRDVMTSLTLKAKCIAGTKGECLKFNTTFTVALESSGKCSQGKEQMGYCDNVQVDADVENDGNPFWFQLANCLIENCGEPNDEAKKQEHIDMKKCATDENNEESCAKKFDNTNQTKSQACYKGCVKAQIETSTTAAGGGGGGGGTTNGGSGGKGDDDNNDGGNGDDTPAGDDKPANTPAAPLPPSTMFTINSTDGSTKLVLNTLIILATFILTICAY